MLGVQGVRPAVVRHKHAHQVSVQTLTIRGVRRAMTHIHISGNDVVVGVF